MKKSIRWWACVVCAMATVLVTASPTHGDALSDLRANQSNADAAASSAQSNVNAALAAVQTANAAVGDAQTKVVTAQNALTAANDAWTQAQNVEAEMAAALFQRDKELTDAKQRVKDGQAKVEAQESAINAYARAIVQDNLPMVNVALLLNGDSSASLANRLQWSDTVLGTNQVDLDQLRQIQADLERDQRQAQLAQIAADKAKREADDQVAAAESARQAAEQAEADLRLALLEEQNAQARANQVLAANQWALGQAQASQAQANQAVDAEIARQAEAARAAEEARRAAEEAARNEANQGDGGGGSAGGWSGAEGQLSPSQAQSAAYGMIQGYGWGDSQFQCLVWLWNRESGWRWSAENPSSGAYGIPQSLPGNKMASAGADWRTNAVTQMRWGLSYISNRYGTPCGAWAHSEATNWY